MQLLHALHGGSVNAGGQIMQIFTLLIRLFIVYNTTIAIYTHKY